MYACFYLTAVSCPSVTKNPVLSSWGFVATVTTKQTKKLTAVAMMPKSGAFPDWNPENTASPREVRSPAPMLQIEAVLLNRFQ